MELLDFSAFGELVEDVNESNKPAPASENPDRQNYQSGVVGAARQFEPEALPQRGDRGTDVSNMQQALVDAGVTSIKKVDGAFGRNTEKGVQEFQKMRGLPETGIYDEETRATLLDDTTRMPDSEEPMVPAPAPVTVGEEADTSKSNLLDFIGKGEGGYDSANRGTINGNVIGRQMVASRGGKKVSELTVAEIKKYQSITDPNNKDRLFTVGKYQAVPDTFNQAVKGLGLSDDTVFTPEVQEKVGLYLVSEKRPTVGKFLRGEGNISTDTAMLQLAMEFASIPVPKAIPKGTYGRWPKTDLVAGDSFYKNPEASRGNRAQHTVKETREILERARD